MTNQPIVTPVQPGEEPEPRYRIHYDEVATHLQAIAGQWGIIHRGSATGRAAGARKALARYGRFETTQKRLYDGIATYARYIGPKVD